MRSHNYTRYNNSYRTCTGTWSLNGQSHTGGIVGASERGGSLAVRVHDGTAYTADAVHNMCYMPYLRPAAALFYLPLATTTSRAAPRAQPESVR